MRLPRVAAFCRADSDDAPNARDDDDDIEATRLARSRRVLRAGIRNTFFSLENEESSLFVWSLDAIHFTRKPTLSHKKKCFETLNGGFGRELFPIYLSGLSLSLSSARRHNLKTRKGTRRNRRRRPPPPFAASFFLLSSVGIVSKEAVLETRKTTGHEDETTSKLMWKLVCSEAIWMPRENCTR